MEGSPKQYLYHMVPKDMRPNEEGKNVLYPLNMLKEKFPDLYEVKMQKYSEPAGDDAKKNEERKTIPERLIPTLEQAAWGDVLNLTAVHPDELMKALESAGFTPQEMKFYQIDPDLLDPELATIYLYREEAGEKEDPKQYGQFDPAALHEHSSLHERTKEYYKQRHEEGKKPLLFVGVPHIMYKGHLDVSDIEKFPVITAVPKTAEKQIEVSEEGNDIVFTIHGEQNAMAASLQCEKDLEKKLLIARTIIVEKDFKRQGLGSRLFIDAIEYAKKNGLGFATDYGISEDADKLIQSLSTKGYAFVKNPAAIEREGSSGKRIVTFDGSPVYTLNEAAPSEQFDYQDVDLRTIDNGRLIYPSKAEGSSIHQLNLEGINIPVSFAVLPGGHFRLNGLQEDIGAGLVMSGLISGTEAKINHVIVDAELRQAAKQKGNVRVGEAALFDLENQLKENGASTIYAVFYSPETIDFFRRNGYEVVSVESLSDDTKLRLGIDPEGFAPQIKDSETFEKMRSGNPDDYRHVLLKKSVF